MTHAAVDALLILGIFLAYIIGKFRGFNDGAHYADGIVDSRNREIEELLRTGKAQIEVSYYPADKQ